MRILMETPACVGFKITYFIQPAINSAKPALAPCKLNVQLAWICLGQWIRSSALVVAQPLIIKRTFLSRLALVPNSFLLFLLECHNYCDDCTGPASTQCIACQTDHGIIPGGVTTTCICDTPHGFYENAAYNNCRGTNIS